jgi:hypothetical protein
MPGLMETEGSERVILGAVGEGEEEGDGEGEGEKKGEGEGEGQGEKKGEEHGEGEGSRRAQSSRSSRRHLDSQPVITNGPEEELKERVRQTGGRRALANRYCDYLSLIISCLYNDDYYYYY